MGLHCESVMSLIFISGSGSLLFPTVNTSLQVRTRGGGENIDKTHLADVSRTSIDVGTTIWGLSHEIWTKVLNYAAADTQRTTGLTGTNHYHHDLSLCYAVGSMLWCLGRLKGRWPSWCDIAVDSGSGSVARPSEIANDPRRLDR